MIRRKLGLSDANESVIADSTGLSIQVRIPGEPYALMRARATTVGKHARIYDPPKNRSWKAYAASFMQQAMAGLRPLTGPVSLVLTVQFSMPRSRWRKQTPRPWEWHAKRPDLDNVVKAVKDAAKGILWHDDSQVCRLKAEKYTGAQEEAPYLLMTVTQLNAYEKPSEQRRQKWENQHDNYRSRE